MGSVRLYHCPIEERSLMMMGSLTKKGVTSRPVSSGIYTIFELRMQVDYVQIIWGAKTLKLF